MSKNPTNRLPSERAAANATTDSADGSFPDTSGFWNPKSLEQLAAEQGVKPVENPEELRGDFWPEDESMDEFLAWLRKLRREGREEA